MLKKLLYIVLGLIIFTNLALAYEPGFFMPFYFLYGNITTDNPDKATIDNHQVVFFKDTPQVMGSISKVSNGKYLLNIMDAQYWGKFNIAFGDKYFAGVPIIADGYGKNPINFDVSDLKGYKQLDITLKLGEGAGLLPPMGTVPLTIDKEGNDIKLSWDFAAYGNDILIYYLKGDGTGQYTNSFASWAPASLYNPSSVIGSLYDKNQFLDGDKERYYKAIKNDQIPEAKVPVAWAVGKIIIDVSKGYDFISMPLIPFKGTSISNVFMGQLDVQGVESYSFDELTVMMSKANFTNGAWAYSPNVPFGISSGKSYWLQLPADQKLSLIGAVKTTPFTKAMPANGYVTLGATLPTLIDFQTVGLTAKNGDQIYYFNNITKLFEKISDSGGWQNATPGQKVFSFIPAAGYWYKNEGASFDWIK